MSDAQSSNLATSGAGAGSARLLAVGDVYINRTGFAEPFGDLTQLMRGADVRFCNLEAPVTESLSPLPDRPYPLNTPPENLRLFEAGGFDAVAIAHNHLMDFGLRGLEQTLERLRAQAIPAIGAGENAEQAMAPLHVVRNGIRFGFLALACAFPPGAQATRRRAGIAGIRVHTRYQPQGDFAAEHPGMPPIVCTTPHAADHQRLIAAVARLKEQVDHVVVSFHWGVPGLHEVCEYQQRIAHGVIDAGASLVLGHHAHVLQGVERYRRGLIFYGLSHVVFDMPGIISSFGFDEQTAAAEITFTRAAIQDACLHPLMMPEGHGPRSPSQTEYDAIAEKIVELSRPLNTSLVRDDSRRALRVDMA